MYIKDFKLCAATSTNEWVHVNNDDIILHSLLFR